MVCALRLAVSQVNMDKAKMTGFCKNGDCPPSNQLLAFQNGDLAQTQLSSISRHLANCEFCSAEVAFYSNYPQAEGPVETSEIPAPLFELAEALLKNRHNGARSLNSLLTESKELIADSIK